MANGLQVGFLLAGVMGSNNKPLASGKVWTYGAGGSTETSVYTDATLLTAATNPVILDARGSANVYASGNYKFVIKDKNDVTIATYDNLYFVVPETEATDVVTTATAYTATTNPEIIAVNTAAGNIAVTLPDAAGNEGLRKTLFKTSADSNSASFTPDGADTINGAASWSTTTQYGFGEIISDGTNWLLINSNVSTGVVTTSSSDTLTNKTLSDSTTYFADNTDPTKKLQFQISGVTTGTTRTLTVPDASDTIVTLAATQTLTNKTLTAPNLGGNVVLASGADIYTTDWTDYGGTSTVVGWSSFTEKHIYYKRVGDIIFVNFYLVGTSNATSATFTLPVAGSSTTLPEGVQSWGAGQDNTSGLSTPMRFSSNPPTNDTISLFPGTSGNWTASGTKMCAGSFFYSV